MSKVTKTVNKIIVNGNEVFIYTFNVSFSGLTQLSEEAYLIDFFPTKILYTLPQIGGVINSITQTPVLGGENVKFDFGLVTLATSISFTVACQFGPGRTDDDTFINKTALYVSNNLVTTGEAPKVTLKLNGNFTLEKTANNTQFVNAGDELTYTLSLTNNGDYGALIKEVDISDILPPQLIALSTPIGNDVPTAGYSDPTSNGKLGSLSNNTISFNLQKYRGVRYDITFKVKIIDTVIAGEKITNTSEWMINKIAQQKAQYTVTIFSHEKAFILKKTGTRTGTNGSPISYFITNENVDKNIYNNYVLIDEIPLEVDISHFSFTTLLPNYNISMSLSNNPLLFIPLVIGGSGNTVLIDLSPYILLGTRVSTIKVTAPSLPIGSTSYHKLSLFGIVNKTAKIGQTVINTATASADNIKTSITFTTTINGKSDLSIIKSILLPKPAYFPLDEFKFVLATASLNTITINPIISDLLPSSLHYILDSEYFIYIDPLTNIRYDSRNPSFPVPLPVRSIINDFANTGNTLIRWSFDFITPLNAILQVIFTVFVKIDPPSSFTNIAYEGNVGSNVLFVYNSVPDTLDFDGDGITEEIISSASLTGIILTTSEFLLQKRVKGESDLDYSSAGVTTAGGDVDYQLNITNNQSINLTNIEVVDIFPYIGDTGVILTNVPRGSQFQVYPTSTVNVKIINLLGTTIVPDPLVVIEYSTSNDPLRFDELGNQIGTGTWSLTPPLDITSLRAIRVLTDPSVILKPYERLIISIKAKSPLGTSSGLLAYNSFAVRADKIVGETPTALLPTEPSKVSVKITINKLARIGQFVWNDANGDGIYQPTEVGVNGIAVILYDMNLKVLATTVTSNNFAGEPGYYVFDELLQGNYYVKFVPYAPLSLTVQNLNVPFGSKPNKTTGLTDLIILGENESIMNINAGVLQECLPPIIIATDKCILLHQKFNPLEGVTAFDCRGNNITAKIVVLQNTVNINIVGVYLVVYSVTDSLGQTTVKTISVVVCKASPRQQAINDLIESIALQQTAISHILNAEGEKIQKAISLLIATNELIKINSSVANTVRSLSNLELVLQDTISLFDCRLCHDSCCKNK